MKLLLSYYWCINGFLVTWMHNNRFDNTDIFSKIWRNFELLLLLLLFVSFCRFIPTKTVLIALLVRNNFLDTIVDDLDTNCFFLAYIVSFWNAPLFCVVFVIFNHIGFKLMFLNLKVVRYALVIFMILLYSCVCFLRPLISKKILIQCKNGFCAFLYSDSYRFWHSYCMMYAISRCVV